MKPYFQFKPDEGQWPQFAVKARLDGIKPIGPSWAPEASKAFQRLVGPREDLTPVDVKVKKKRWEGDRLFVDLEFDENGQQVDVASRLESLGLVLLEFQEGATKKVVKSWDSKIPMLLKEVSRSLRHKELDVDPSLLREITREHQEISVMIEKKLDSAEIDKRQGRLVQNLLGLSLGQIFKNPEIHKKSLEEGSSVAQPDVKGSSH